MHKAVAAVIDISENNHLTTRPSVRHAQATKSPPKKFSLKKAFGFFSSLLETFIVTATSAEPTANMTATSHSQQETFRLLNGRIIVNEGPDTDFTLNGTNGPGNLGDLFDTFEHDLSLPPSPYESHTGEREDRETPTPSAQTAPSSNNVSLARASTVFSEYSQPPSKPLISLLGQHLTSTATSGATRVDNGHTSTRDGGQVIASTERAADEGHQADQNELRQPTLPGANTPKERIGRQPMTQTTKKVIATLPPFLGRTRAATSKQIGEEAERLAKCPSTRSAVPTTPVQVTNRQHDLQTAWAATLLKHKAKKVVSGITDQVSKRGAKKQRSAAFERPVRRLKVERGKVVVVIPGEKVDLKESQGFD